MLVFAEALVLGLTTGRTLSKTSICLRTLFSLVGFKRNSSLLATAHIFIFSGALNQMEEEVCFWALTQVESTRRHPRLVAFAVVEGIFFSGSCCALFWLRGRMGETCAGFFFPPLPGDEKPGNNSVVWGGGGVEVGCGVGVGVGVEWGWGCLG